MTKSIQTSPENVEKPIPHEFKLLRMVDPELAALLADRGSIPDFIKELRATGDSFSEDQLRQAAITLREKMKLPMSDDELDMIAGGTSNYFAYKKQSDTPDPYAISSSGASDEEHPSHGITPLHLNSTPSHHNSPVFVFSKSETPTFDALKDGVAWKVIADIGRESSSNFTFPIHTDVQATWEGGSSSPTPFELKVGSRYTVDHGETGIILSKK